MICQECRQSTSMKSLNVGDFSIDECPRCRGLWFDKGELEEFKDEVDPDLRFLGFEIWSQEAIFNVNDEALDCPRCQNVSMRGVHFIEPDLTIDFCPYCEGVWLNFGNFRDIVEAFSAEAENKSLPEYVKTSLKEALEIITNPKNLVSEWKDLKAVLRMLRYRVFVENPKFRSILEGIQKTLPL